jgi:hypothetical protein
MCCSNRLQRDPPMTEWQAQLRLEQPTKRPRDVALPPTKTIHDVGADFCRIIESF